jgi:HD-GYP domain-containing protein (c-di-GMP phosphodiesterase class II)
MHLNKNRSIVKLYKRQIITMLMLLIMAISAIISLLFMNFKINYENSSLVNVLGHQRMLTQMMAKYSDRIFELHSVSNLYSSDVKESENIKDKTSFTIDLLRKAEADYDTHYKVIKEGYVEINSRKISFDGALTELRTVFNEHDKIWPDFKKNIDIVLNEKSNTTEFIQATKYINENNEILLGYSDKITNIVLNHNKGVSLKLFYLIAVMGIIVLILLLIFFLDSYKNLFLPVNQLYNGFTSFGINNMEIEIPRTKNEELKPLFNEVENVFHKLRSLILLIENLSKNERFSKILQYIYDSFMEYIPYTYIGVALIEDDGQTIRASYAAAGEFNNKLPKKLLGYKTNIDRTSLGKVIESGEPRVINDLEKYVKGKDTKDYNTVLLEESIRASITFPLTNNNGPVGIIFFSSDKKNVYKDEHVSFLKILANSIMLSLEEDILIEDMIVGSTLALATLTEERDNETGEHLKRMKKYSMLIAELLSKKEKYENIIDTNFVKDIERFSPLHDIGKVAIRDEILLKPAKLTKEEFDIMKTHTIYGGKVLRLADENVKKIGHSIFKMGIEIAEGHHERWDGAGYPYGKKNEEIPLSARIVALADVLDALTSKRPYKKAFSFEESLNMIYEERGTHFDPYIVDILKENTVIFEEYYKRFHEK